MKNCVSNRELDKTMRYILQYSNMSDDQLNDLASSESGRLSLSVLKSLKAIDYKVAFGGGRLYQLSVLDDGILYFYRKYEQRVGFWKGFFTGILSAAASSVLANLIIWAVRFIASMP